jgi:hypothetical protein
MHIFKDERPHEALGMKYPAELYVSSSRPLRRKSVTHVLGMKWLPCGQNGPEGGGGPCRDRTYDQEIKSLLLYQLS